MPALHVPDHAALILILRAGLIPIDVQQEAVRFVRTDDGLVIDARIDKATRAKLTRAGFKLGRRWTFGVGERASCWAEIVPCEIAQEPEPPLGELLFIVQAKRAIGLCSELLRLGGDRQSLCFFEGHKSTQMAAVRAIEPPYYAVLKGLAGEVHAYQGAGRVRVAVGYRHRLSDQLAAPVGELLLIGADAWQTVPDGPWVDLHQVTDVTVRPNQPLPVIEAPIRIPVSLRLARAPKLGSPQGWVLTQQARPQLEILVRTLPDSVIEQLRFVAAGPPDDPTIVLRARRGRGASPQLELDGTAYVPTPGVPNLWLPWGQGIDPPIRAGRQAALLAPDPQNLYWATPLEAVRRADFRMNSVAESAFAPLSDFIEYLVTAERAAIEPWIRSAIFDFASFTVADPSGQATRSTPKKELKPARSARSGSSPERRSKQRPIAPEIPQIVLPDPPKAPEQVIQAITTLERAFCSLDSPLSDPERGPLWAQLAHLEANAGRSAEAAICRIQAIWALPSESSAPLVKSWAQTLRGQTESLFKLLKRDSPSRLEIQSIGLQILASPALSGDKLSTAQTWMGRFEARLDVRTRWLVRQALCGWSGGDRLGLLRTRDGIIRAMHNGLPVAANVPAFIRAFRGGIKGQLNVLQDALGDLWTQYQQTARSRHALEAKPELTDAYVALTFAWAHAQFGDAVMAQQLRAFAANQLPNDPVHTILQQTYALRLEEAADAQPMGGALPQSLLAAQQALPALDGFKVNRLWAASSILDGSMGRDAFKAYSENQGAGRSRLELLRLESDLDQVTHEFDTIFAQGPPAEDESAIERWWQQAFDVIDGLPESLSVPRLRNMLAAVSTVNPSLKGRILAMVIRQAGAINQTSLIQQALADLIKLVEQVPDSELPSLTEEIGRISADCQRAGLSGEVLALLSTIESRLDGAGVALLELLTTRSALGETVDFSAARDAVIAHIGAQREPRMKQRLTRQLAFAVGRTSAEQATATIAQLMPQLKTTTDMMSTSSHFCFSVIHFMESMVLMLTSDQLWLDPWARRWVEADEHLIRHRIHDDLSGVNE